MIDERELYSLGEPGHGPPTPHRPVAAVLARGARLRRRRQAVRAVGTSTVVAGLIGSGLFLRERRGGEPDVSTADDPTTTTEAPSAPPPPAAGCEGTFTSGETIGPAEVPDDMRILPGFVPGDPAITYAAGQRHSDPCPGAAPVPVDNALELLAPGPDGVSEQEIWLQGPLPTPVPDNVGVRRWSTELRGGDATGIQPAGSPEDVAFSWTEPDGWSWWIQGMKVDEPTVRALAEALVLDSSPDGDEPVATVPPEAIPVGFQITWQTIGPPKTTTYSDSVTWSVSFGTTGDDGMRCELQVTQRESEAPLEGRGTEHVTVNGQDAIWHPVGGEGPLGLGSLAWIPSPGVTALMGCVDQSEGPRASIDVDTMIQVAESVVPVAADDPRFPN